jgi:hypothetical protein
MRRWAIALAMVLVPILFPDGITASEDGSHFIPASNQTAGVPYVPGANGRDPGVVLRVDDDCPFSGVGCVPEERAVRIQEVERTPPVLILPTLIAAPLFATALYLFCKALWDHFKYGSNPTAPSGRNE